MKVFKSDGRYKLHNRGYTYIAEFRWKNRDDDAAYSTIGRGLESMHGPQWLDMPGKSILGARRMRNENYVLEVNKNAKRRRIYVKNESDITMALLKG